MRRIGWLSVLAIVTGVAAWALLPVNLDAYTVFNDDPQGIDQQLAAWRQSAAFTLTSGSIVGQLCALLYGFVARRPLWTAVVGGAVLALVNLAVVIPLGIPQLVDLWLVDEMTSHGYAFSHNVFSHTPVTGAVLATYLAYPVWAALGALLHRWWAVVWLALVIPVFAVTQTYAPLYAAILALVVTVVLATVVGRTRKRLAEPTPTG